MITLEQVLKAYEYANSHPHKYLRGTTNWCAAVAHSLNEQTPAAQPHGEPVAYLYGLDRLKNQHVVGCAASLSKNPGKGFVAIFAEQPAPVAVVMPEPYGLAMFKMLSGFDSVTPEQFNLVWTACRKEVARLNGVTK